VIDNYYEICKTHLLLVERCPFARPQGKTTFKFKHIWSFEFGPIIGYIIRPGAYKGHSLWDTTDFSLSTGAFEFWNDQEEILESMLGVISSVRLIRILKRLMNHLERVRRGDGG